MPPHRTGSFYMRTNPVRLPTPARGQRLLAPGLASNPLTTESQLNPTQSPIVKMNGLRLVVAQCFFFANALRQDIFIVKFKKAAGVTHANKYETDWMNMPHIKAGNRRVDGILFPSNWFVLVNYCSLTYYSVNAASCHC